ncbi:hypothetical protein [Dyella lutea]|uniref:Cytochrome c domain-containing protein n=1 Tax=Dyella lutea TaxID=2950441 RepID=A0ABT1F9H2_9GAMM|nr:hypothetical protein [Dyella lutea]MCP1373093.1 hypothetical protein [Dyella lutea]
MKIRTLSMVAVLTAVASGAVAGEAIHSASNRAPVNRMHEALGIRDTRGFADVVDVRGFRAAAAMPACSTCHNRQ